MQIFALFMLCGMFTSFLIPETARKTLEELAGEDAPENVMEHVTETEGKHDNSSEGEVLRTNTRQDPGRK